MSFYLVDTSAWILSFSPNPPARLKNLLSAALDLDEVQTCGVVVAELLQGCRDDQARNTLKDKFTALSYLEWPEKEWVTLGDTSARLRGSGITVPVTDLLIALLAVRHRSIIIHRDRHYDLMARHLSFSAVKI